MYAALLNSSRVAIRRLLRSPGFCAISLATLALGIGANTAVFSVVRGLLLRPLPYPDSDRLVILWESAPERGIDRQRVSGPNYLDWRSQNTVLADLAVLPGWQGSSEFNLVRRDGVNKIHGTYASASFFTTLASPPLLGRFLLPEDDREEGNRVVVLSYSLWKRIFGGDTNVLGTTLTLDSYGRRDYTIVGIMPPGFGSPSPAELWLPLGWMGVTLEERRAAHWHQVIARLKPGVSREKAELELSTIQSRLAQTYPEATLGSRVQVVPMVHEALGDQFHRALLVLWAVVSGVLLIACVNVANLQLAHATAHRREVGLRLALGARRWQIAIQCLQESLILALLGGILGSLLAWGGVQLFVTLAPATIPRLHEVSLDGVALLYTLGLSILTALVFGATPAWHGTRADLVEILKSGDRGTTDSRSIGRARSLLIVLDVGLSLVLLVAAGLMLQTVHRLLGVDRGFRPEQLLTVNLDFSVSGFTTWIRPTATRPQVSLKDCMDRLRALPGVEWVGASSTSIRQDDEPPPETVTIFGRTRSGTDSQPKAHFSGVSPDWSSSIGARLLRGRDFTEADTLESEGVVLINESFARLHFPGKDPVGQYLRMGTGQAPLGATNTLGQSVWSRIVGVIADVQPLNAPSTPTPEVYVSYWQWPMQSPTLYLRASGDLQSLAIAVRREIKAFMPQLPEPEIRTMNQRLSDFAAPSRLQARLLALFGAIALVLSAVGIYGVVSVSVNHRIRELGIRIVLGAQTSTLMRLVMGRTLGLAALGLVLGAIAAAFVGHLIESQLYGVGVLHPPTFAGAAGLLLLTAILAGSVPMRRAVRINPVEALRND